MIPRLSCKADSPTSLMFHESCATLARILSTKTNNIDHLSNAEPEKSMIRIFPDAELIFYFQMGFTDLLLDSRKSMTLCTNFPDMAAVECPRSQPQIR